MIALPTDCSGPPSPNRSPINVPSTIPASYIPLKIWSMLLKRSSMNLLFIMPLLIPAKNEPQSPSPASPAEDAAWCIFLIDFANSRMASASEIALFSASSAPASMSSYETSPSSALPRSSIDEMPTDSAMYCFSCRLRSSQFCPAASRPSRSISILSASLALSISTASSWTPNAWESCDTDSAALSKSSNFLPISWSVFISMPSLAAYAAVAISSFLARPPN